MEQNLEVDNDLQKAIDDITNNTSVDPVFSDPVAAPTSVPTGDDGGLGEAIGPFPDAMNIPTPSIEETMAPVMDGLDVTSVLPMPDANPTEENIEEAPIPVAPEAPEVSVAEEVQEAPAEAPEEESFASQAAAADLKQVKEAALRDLAPLLDKMSVNPSQKFKIYKDMYSTLNDKSLLEPAYRAAKSIEDETERGEALLYLVDTIDKM